MSSATRAVFVVGAGRSGTSALTRGVAALGVDLGDHLKAATGKNPTGFFEDRDLLGIAKRVRGALGLRSESVALIGEGRWSAADLSPLHREAVDLIRRRFGDAPLWGFKYAQTLRMLPFWEQVFQIAELDVSYVVAVRNPLSVARSRAALDPRRGFQEKSDLEWLVNVVPYFRRMAERPFTVVDYDLLMGDPVGQLLRVAAQLELSTGDRVRAEVAAFADSFLRADMRHTAFDDADLERSETLNPLVRDAYRWLYQLASDEIGPEDPALWRDWARIESAVANLAPVLEHVDRLEAELRRRRFSPTSALRALWKRLPRPAR